MRAGLRNLVVCASDLPFRQFFVLFLLLESRPHIYDHIVPPICYSEYANIHLPWIQT